MDGSVVATLAGMGLGLVFCTATCIICRIWRRNRYYKKVQHSLDEEERAFQECAAPPRCRRHLRRRHFHHRRSAAAPQPPAPRAAAARARAARRLRRTLSRNYNDEELQLDRGDKEKLQMLESYMATMADDGDAASAAPMPTKVEDVDKFMAELAAAAGSGSPVKK